LSALAAGRLPAISRKKRASRTPSGRFIERPGWRSMHRLDAGFKLDSAATAMPGLLQIEE